MRGGDRHNQRAGIQGAPMRFSFLFVYWLFQQHHANIIPLANAPLLADQHCLDVVSMIESHVVAHHHMTPLKHWGACPAPQLPFPWLSDPCKVAWQCRLTLALPLQGLLVISGGITLCGLEYLWVFINPLPVPVKTCACRCGHVFWWVWVWVTLENPRVACDIP